MSNIKYLFGLPIWIEKIDPETFQKKKIISQIEENFKTSQIRNNWSKDSFVTTDIHHSNSDENNKNFNKINYYDLNDRYKTVINNYFEKIGVQNDFSFKYEIVNYTCANRNSFMTPHIHGGCSFSMVHYLSFDKKEHNSTIFKSPYYFINLLPNKNKLKNIFNGNFLENSWLDGAWVFDTEEDDVIIFPAILEHSVRNFDSEKLRITISVNVEID
jgi:hypothetical protein